MGTLPIQSQFNLHRIVPTAMNWKTPAASTIISSVALSVSFLSLFLSYIGYSSDTKFKNISIRPYIEVLSDENEIFITNKGMGYARIMSAYSYLQDPPYDGSPIITPETEDNWERAFQDMFEFFKNQHDSQIRDTLSKIDITPSNIIGAIMPGKEAYFVRYNYDQLDNENNKENSALARAYIKKFHKSVRLSLCFVDGAGNLYVRPSIRVESARGCILPEASVR